MRIFLADVDIWLTEAIETSPIMMRELGGRVPTPDIPRIHARRRTGIGPDAWCSSERVAQSLR